MNRQIKKVGPVLTVALLWGVALLLSGCAGHSQSFFQSQAVMYRSQDFIFYRLQKGETPSILAERFLGSAEKEWVITEKNEGVSCTSGQTILIPLNAENRGGITSKGYQVVPIFCYHRFETDCNSKLCIPGPVFDRQMKYLKDNGYHVITARQLFEFLAYQEAIPKRSVVLTIDDGYRSAYDVAYPILKKYGFTATIFVYTNFVGVSSSAVTWDQLREMKENGFEIGSHTISHCDLTKPLEGENFQAYRKRIGKELIRSKAIIDQKLHQDTAFLAYPFGRHNETVRRLAQRAGYQFAVTVTPGENPFFADSFTLNRRQVLSRDDNVFISKLYTMKKF